MRIKKHSIKCEYKLQIFKIREPGYTYYKHIGNNLEIDFGRVIRHYLDILITGSLNQFLLVFLVFP